MDIPHSKSQMAGFVGALLDAGIGTMMLTHVLWLAAHPWVQKKAWEEIDKVVGSERYVFVLNSVLRYKEILTSSVRHRLPVWSDFPNLPYINCIMKEGLRIRPL